MVKIDKLIIDLNFLESIHNINPTLLDEMALPSYFHNNPFIRWITTKRIKKVLELIEIGAGTRLLDYGCGSGVLLLQLPENVGEYIGVDLELWPAEMVLKHHNRNDIQLIQVGNWKDIVSDNSQDYIIATEVLEHVDDVASIINDLEKKLKPGGSLIVSLPTENYFYKLGRKIAQFSGDYHKEEGVNLFPLINGGNLAFEKGFVIPFYCPFCLYEFFLLKKEGGNINITTT